MHLACLLTYLLFQFQVPVKYSSENIELKQCFLHGWHNIDQTIINNAIDVWHGHLCACVRVKGGHFEQLF